MHLAYQHNMRTSEAGCRPELPTLISSGAPRRRHYTQYTRKSVAMVTAKQVGETK